MKEKKGNTSSITQNKHPDGRLDFSQNLLRYTIQDRPKFDFLSDVLTLVLEYSGCDAVELWLEEGKNQLRCEVFKKSGDVCCFKILDENDHSENANMPGQGSDADLEKLCRYILHNHGSTKLPFYTKYGSFWTGDSRKSFSLNTGYPSQTITENICIRGNYRSLALVPLRLGEEKIGLIHFKNKNNNYYNLEKIEYFETIAAKFELALLHQRSQAKMHERVKELTCLYGIAQIASQPDMSFDHKLLNIVKLLPAAWQYPAHASARIIIDKKTFQTPFFLEGSHKQIVSISVRGIERGAVEVSYLDNKSLFYGDPFLDEEESLINNIAGQLASMIEHRETEEIKSELQNQLIRADRLSAIGQLAAGVAHELNEPLNAILGFAQLVMKSDGISAKDLVDIKKIADASLHARKIIRELLVFARQAKPSRTQVNLNQIVEEELNLFESLCAKSGVELRRVLDQDLPEIVADRSQILQVLSNLIVNALQAMPDGGVLTIKTKSEASMVSLILEDTGIGMSEEVMENIFVPFFTTKDVDQGTGLGLAVVHGIVSSHGGKINVESSFGQGARFLITLPHDHDTVMEVI